MRSLFYLVLLLIQFYPEKLLAQCHQGDSQGSSSSSAQNDASKDENSEALNQDADSMHAFLAPPIDDIALSELFIGGFTIGDHEWNFVFAQSSVEVAELAARFTREKKSYSIEPADRHSYPPGSDLFFELRNRHKTERSYNVQIDDEVAVNYKTDEFVELIDPDQKIYCDYWISEAGSSQENRHLFTLYRNATSEEIEIFNALYDAYLIKKAEFESTKQLFSDAEHWARLEVQKLRHMNKKTKERDVKTDQKRNFDPFVFGAGAILGASVLGLIWSQSNTS